LRSAPAANRHAVDWHIATGRLSQKFLIAILVGVFMAVSRPVLGQRRSVLLTISSVVVYTL
jgi:hypothetical protein